MQKEIEEVKTYINIIKDNIIIFLLPIIVTLIIGIVFLINNISYLHNFQKFQHSLEIRIDDKEYFNLVREFENILLKRDKLNISSQLLLINLGLEQQIEFDKLDNLSIRNNFYEVFNNFNVNINRVLSDNYKFKVETFDNFMIFKYSNVDTNKDQFEKDVKIFLNKKVSFYKQKLISDVSHVMTNTRKLYEELFSTYYSNIKIELELQEKEYDLLMDQQNIEKSNWLNEKIIENKVNKSKAEYELSFIDKIFEDDLSIRDEFERIINTNYDNVIKVISSQKETKHNFRNSYLRNFSIFLTLMVVGVFFGMLLVLLKQIFFKKK